MLILLNKRSNHYVNILGLVLIFFDLFLEIFDICTEATGAFEEIFFSSLKILAFFATKDLFF